LESANLPNCFLQTCHLLLNVDDQFTRVAASRLLNLMATYPESMIDIVMSNPTSARHKHTTLPDCNLNRWQRFEEDSALQLMPEHRQHYLQIQHEAPNLLWLYILMATAGINLAEGEVVAAMKARLLQEPTLTPEAWRFVANGNILDFWVVLEVSDPDEEPAGRWNLLVSWLQILSGLGMDERYLPVHLQQLFLNDSLLVNLDAPEIEVDLRGAWMSFNTLRCILNEARSRLSMGTIDHFIEKELPAVITWIAAADPCIDRNQERSGWQFLVRSAEEWRSGIEDRPIAEKQVWRSNVNFLPCGDWRVDGITNAWDLHRLSLSQRHCADRFLDGCLADLERIFTISGDCDKICATVRLSRCGTTWTVSEVRGFANGPVSEHLHKLSRKLANCYTNEWQMATDSASAS